MHDVPLYCQFAQIDSGLSRLPDESTILRFCHLLETGDLSQLIIAANINDVTQGHALLHLQEAVVFADAGYEGAGKWAEATGVKWQVALRRGKRRAEKSTVWGALLEQAEKLGLSPQ